MCCSWRTSSFWMAAQTSGSTWSRVRLRLNMEFLVRVGRENKGSRDAAIALVYSDSAPPPPPPGRGRPETGQIRASEHKNRAISRLPQKCLKSA
ncbi:Uncharacterised protein [Bordetella pertussis]|nr:Uncharacterised protein [Bordetella pertussis]